MKQQNLFNEPALSTKPGLFIPYYRIALVRDNSVHYAGEQLANSRQAQPIIKKLIEMHGQSDREQFCVVLLNAKNAIIGLNIVSVGSVSSAQVCPREVLKSAILVSASAMILAHNHPSGDVQPSPEDLALTEKLIQAASIIGIQIHEHIIVSMFDDHYYSFADNGLIKYE